MSRPNFCDNCAFCLQNTTILCDMRLYCEDKELWGDPEKFRPDRFIGENGELVNASSIIAFSFGEVFN